MHASRGQRCPAGLQHQAQLNQLTRRQRAERRRGEWAVHALGIRVRAAHHHTLARQDVYEAKRFQHGQGFAQRGAAHPQACRQFTLRRQPGATGVIAAHDALL